MQQTNLIKKVIFSLFAVMCSCFLFAQKNKGMVIIKGTLNGDLKGYNRIYMYTRLSNDSAEITNGNYTFSFPFSEVGMKFLYPQYIQAQHMMYQPFGILISEPGTYYVVSDIEKGMPASVLKGNESMELYQQFEQDQKEAYKKINPVLDQLYGNRWWAIEEKDPKYPDVQKSSDSLKVVFLLPLIQRLVKEHPDSYASAYVLSGSGKAIGSIAQKEQLYQMLSSKIQSSKAGRDFSDYILGLKNSVVGKTVVNFILPNPDGADVNFNDLKGKYVLIDFWASWCVPCRRSFPHMREVYKKYKSDKFEIYSVSIDEDKSAWLKAVKEEKNPWLQSWDDKNISQKGFAVTGVPSTFLIDPQGEIIAKEVGFDPDGGSEIEKKIREIFSADGKSKAAMIKMN